jgi:hypothetical protein
VRLRSSGGLGRREFVCACCAGVAIGWSPRVALAAAEPIPTRLEPHHHVRLQNEYMRVLQIIVDPSDATLWHEHTLDFAGVTVQGSELRNETANSDKVAIIQAKSGTLSYFQYQGRSFVHRVVNTGRDPFTVAGMEILVPSAGGFPPSDRKASPAYALELDNDRLRAWRLKLAPGESAPPVVQGGPGFRVVIGGDRMTEMVGAGPDQVIDAERGSFAYQPPGTTRMIRNSGSVPVELVEFELK